MHYYYRWQYLRHEKLVEKYSNTKMYPNLYNINIEKLRYYATKLGWLT